MVVRISDASSKFLTVFYRNLGPDEQKNENLSMWPSEKIAKEIPLRSVLTTLWTSS